MDTSGLNSAQLQNFVEEQKAAAATAQVLANITSVCWDKCITGTPGGKFSSSESSCLTNCARRYADMVMSINSSVQQN
ncbi:hypothetical protein ACJIZ3_018254 [Penstemon smallii]|uniref:Mitochondrial import inner membrane translocase subunit n=1 Tax=Penstemon smallii TaxID=265156 RepID=A0ABD3SXX1_9LAMI